MVGLYIAFSALTLFTSITDTVGTDDFNIVAIKTTMSKVTKRSSPGSRRTPTPPRSARRGCSSSRRSSSTSPTSTGNSPASTRRSNSLRLRCGVAGLYRRRSSAARIITVRMAELRPFSVRIQGRNVRIVNDGTTRGSTSSITEGLGRMRCSSSSGGPEVCQPSGEDVKEDVYQIYYNINLGMDVEEVLKEPEGRQIAAELANVSHMLEKIKKRKEKKLNYVYNAMRKVRNISSENSEDTAMHRQRSISSSSNNSVFVENTPKNGGGDDDADGGRARVQTSPVKSGRRMTYPLMVRMYEEARLESIFYSDSTDEEEGKNNRPVAESSSHQKEEEVVNNRKKEEDEFSSTSSVEILDEIDPDTEVITISDSDDVEYLGEPDEPDAPEDRGEPSKVKEEDSVDMENYETVDSEESSEAGDSIDMSKVEPEDDITMEDLHERVTLMLKYHEAYSLKEVQRIKLKWMKIISEDRDLTDLEDEVYNMLRRLVEKITQDSVKYVAVGDGLKSDKEENESGTSDEINVVSSDTEEDQNIVDMEEEENNAKESEE